MLTSFIDEKSRGGDIDTKSDSPWPPRNAPCFSNLNAFMERCNDVLELVQTTRHFSLLADAAKVGGAGSRSLDALVKEIHERYIESTNEFFSSVDDVLDTFSPTFNKAFFHLRMSVRDLERKLASVLRSAFLHCPTLYAQLRLLEVFEGVSEREHVRLELKVFLRSYKNFYLKFNINTISIRTKMKRLPEVYRMN